MTAEIKKASHAGTLKIGDMEIPCAVLEDGTRVLSERGVTKALGATRSGHYWAKKKGAIGGAVLPVFVAPKNIKPFVSNDLTVALSEVLPYTAYLCGGCIDAGRYHMVTIPPFSCSRFSKGWRSAGTRTSRKLTMREI